MSASEYKVAYSDLEGWDNEWCMVDEHSLIQDIREDLYFSQEPDWVMEAEDFYEKYERQQSKKPAKRKQSTKKGHKKQGKLGKTCSTADPAFAAELFTNAYTVAMREKEQDNIIPSSPRDALRRMNIQAGAFSTLDMDMKIITTWVLDRPTIMTVSVPVPVCLLKRREPLKASEFSRLMFAVWDTYRNGHHFSKLNIKYHSCHIYYFIENNLIVDFTVLPLDG
jgi:hypothetical protein